MADNNLDILNITPHQVSRNLRGCSVLFYGEPKSGKTTTATRFPKHLLLASTSDKPNQLKINGNNSYAIL